MDTFSLVKKLRSRPGFSAVQFLRENPRVDYEALIRNLGVDAAPIRLMDALGRMCRDEGGLEWFARDLMVRRIHQMCPNGWVGRGFDSAHALAAACSVLGIFDDEAERMASSAADILVQDESIPLGWKPTSADDPLLVRAFRP